MQILILCAGLGTRLRPYTDAKPKCLVDVAGKPMLERQLENLHAAGASEILIVGGYLGDQLMQYGHRFVANPNYMDSNMLVSFFIGLEQIPYNEDVLVSYGDIICEVSVLEKVLQDKRQVTVVSDKSWRSYWESRFIHPESDAESFSLGPNKELLGLGQPITSMDAPDGQFIGLFKFRAAARPVIMDIREQFVREFGELAYSRAFMTDFLEFALSRGLEVGVLEIDRGWFEIDSEIDLDLASTYFELQRE